MASGTHATARLLEIDRVAVRFGGITALAGVSFNVREGEVCGLIGPNGSGKTTLFNCISGIYRPAAGSIRLGGRDLGGIPRHGMAALGIGRTFQNVALFRSMTVAENVMTGAHHRGTSGFLAHALALPAMRREAAARASEARDVLAFLGLAGVADVPAAGLPFGTRKRVELARALIGRPRLLLLDEPAAGLTHGEVDALRDLLRQVRDRYALAILLVEHHMGLVMQVCEHVVALEFGAKIAEGTPDEIRSDPAVIRAYLGDGDAARAA